MHSTQSKPMGNLSNLHSKHIPILPNTVSTTTPNVAIPSYPVHNHFSSPPTSLSSPQCCPYLPTTLSYDKYLSKVLDEKRRRNATASAKFRNRKKQREKETLERWQFLEKGVKELEQETPFLNQLNELRKELNQAKLEKQNVLEKIEVLENEIVWLKSMFATKGMNLPKYSPEIPIESKSVHSSLN